MAKYVPDVKTQRWVIISSGRTSRPSSFEKSNKPAVCPFDEGNEHMTPPELFRIGGGDPNKPGWNVRVVPNKYPITDTHEVIIHDPGCEHNIEQLPLEQVVRILTAYKARYQVHRHDGHVMIFCNQGFHAGASLKHPHSQLVVVPKQINFDALSREPISNVVEDNTFFVTYCPDFSQWPFEVWIAPKQEAETKFGDIKDEELADLAAVLQRTLQRIASVYADPALAHVHGGIPTFGYNYYIYHGTNWFLRITPRFIHRAGFELGTGLNVNTLDPSDAAEILRQRQLPAV